MKWFAKLFLAGLGLVVGPASESAAAEPLAVIVSIPPQAWLVEQIGGNHVAVEVLLAPGESPATYSPTDAQVTSALRSTLFFTIGAPFERGGWCRALRDSGRLRVIDQQQGIELAQGDPHTWLSPRRLQIQARTVAAALAEADPVHAQDFSDNLVRVLDSLETLDLTIRDRLRDYSGSTFLVFHPSWRYFAEDYGLVQMAIEQDGKEPSDRELTELLTAAKRSHVATVFVSPQIHGRGAHAVAVGLHGQVETLDPLAAEVDANLLETTRKLVHAFRRGSSGG